jgi:tetratricopeptide (TPR) repeat protein
MVQQTCGLSECDDDEGLSRGEALPRDTSVRARIDAARGVLADAAALERAGRYGPAIALAERAREDAQALAYHALRAEAQFRLGALYSQASRSGEAERALLQALREAERAQSHHLRAEILVSLVRVTGFELTHYLAAEAWNVARAADARIGDDGRRAHAANVEAQLRYVRGQVRDSIALTRRALALRLRAAGGRSSDVGSLYNGLGLKLSYVGEYAEAEEALERALEFARRELGPEHPRVLYPLYNLGELYQYAGRFDEAAVTYEESLRVGALAFGPDSVELAMTLVRLGECLGRRGHFPEAEASVARALSLWRGAGALRRNDESAALFALGEVAAGREQWVEARRLHLESMRLALELVEPDSYELAGSYDALGRISAAQGAYATALEEHRRSERIYAQTLDAGNAILAEPLAGQAEALLGLRRPREALPLIERALRLLENQSADRAPWAQLQFFHARAQRDLGGDPATVLRLAREARQAVLEDAGRRPLLRRIEALLGGR